MKKIIKITLKTILSLVLTVVVFAVLLIASVFISGSIMYNDSVAAQQARITEMSAIYDDENYVPVDDSIFSDTDVDILKQYKFNDVEYQATHNSYKQAPTILSKICFAIAGEKDLEYEHENLTKQLQKGIRSIELDAWNQNNGFHCLHDDVFDNKSSCADFGLAFQELKIYSEANPEHLPITVLIELKSPKVYSINSNDWTVEALEDFDQLIVDSLGEQLLTPKDMLDLSGYTSLQAMANDNAWPTIEETLGKVVVILHPNNIVESYINNDPTMQTQAMFPSVTGVVITGEVESYFSQIAFVVDNDPVEDFDRVLDLADNQHYFVRTRTDSYPRHPDSRYEGGIASHANILSGDYPPRDGLQVDDDYTCYLDDQEHTIILKPSATL